MTRGAALLGVVIALAGTWLLAADANVPAPGTQAPAVDTSSAVCPAIDEMPPLGSGLVAYRDPATGKLVSAPPDEAASLFREQLGLFVNESAVGLKEVKLPDGSATIDLQGRFQSVYIVTKNPDGTLSVTCAEDADKAAQTLAGQLTPPAPALELQ